MKTRSVNFLKNWYNINISLKKRDFVSRGPSTGYGWRLDRSVAGTDLSLLLIINIWSESPQTNLGMVKKIRIETLLIIKCSNKSSAFEDTSGYIFDHYLFSRGSSSYQPSQTLYKSYGSVSISTLSLSVFEDILSSAQSLAYQSIYVAHDGQYAHL